MGTRLDLSIPRMQLAGNRVGQDSLPLAITAEKRYVSELAGKTYSEGFEGTYGGGE